MRMSWDTRRERGSHVYNSHSYWLVAVTGGYVMEKLFLMWAAHFLCDYPLQGDWLSKAKNHKVNLVGETIWPMALIGHAMVHAAAVYLITGNPALCGLELIIHGATDWAKCDGRIGYNTDQFIHLFCKVVWVMLLLGAP